MKKKFGFFIGLAGLVLLGLQACSMEDTTAICPLDPETNDQEIPIKFTTKAPSSPLTRTNFDGTEWLLNDSIGIYMLYQPTTDIANSVNFNRKYYTKNGSPFNSKSGYDLLVPPGSQEMYYQGTTPLRFIAYYPYLANISGYTIPLDVSIQDRPQDIDVLYSDNAVNINTGNPGVGTPVTLNFFHVLSKLVINVKKGEHTDVNLHGMTGLINSSPLTGTLQLNDYTNLTAGTVLGNVGFVGNGKQNANYDTTYQAILIPHHIDHARELVQFQTVRRLYSWQLPDELTDFEQGKVYTFNLTLNGEADVAYTASIAPWDSVYKNNTSPDVEGSLDETGARFRRVTANGVDTLDVVYIAGNVAFDMGTTKSQVTGSLKSIPVHNVTLDHSYHIMDAPVTVAQYCKFLNDPNNQLVGTIKTGANGSNVDASHWLPTTEVSTSAAVMLYKECTITISSVATNFAIEWNATSKQWVPTAAGGGNLPMTGVTWYGALAYARWAGGTLPTEAQWEYAARGTIAPGIDYIDGSTNGMGMGTYAATGTNPVPVKGARLANGYGLYDMFGNVEEWCYDRVTTANGDYDTATPSTATAATTQGVSRGYYYTNPLSYFFIGARFTNTLNSVFPYLGFRVVFDFEK
ncbi:hypothetical protein FACS189411_00990 [Bacteroidia bacterium]|nr:hypothetical protein FACS189411_00990 [Bacteroidia bacterium]